MTKYQEQWTVRVPKWFVPRETPKELEEIAEAGRVVGDWDTTIATIDKHDYIRGEAYLPVLANWRERLDWLTWDRTHADYMGDTGNVLIRIPGKGTCSYPVSSLTIEQIQDKLGPQPGDVVRFSEGANTRFTRGMGDSAVIDGLHEFLDKGEFMLTFAASAYRPAEEYVSCSGGPCPCAKKRELIATGETEERLFWRWRKGFAGAGLGQNYLMRVPVWKWAGEKEVAA